VNNNTNNNLIVNANSNNSITNNNNTSTLKEEPKKVSVSSRVVPKIPDSGWKDAALPSKKVSYKIPLNVVLNENIINEVDPNQKDQRAYFYGSDYGALPLILADHWDKNAAGADKSMAATYGKDEESFVQSLESQKIDFTEENIIIDNKLAKLIFVGSNASKMSFYCSIVQTVSGEFFSYTFSPKDDSTVNIDLVMFEKFLGSIKY